MSGKFPEIWHRVCANRNITKSVAEQWLNTIQMKYNSESQRFFHNSELLEMKSDFILTNQTNFSDALILAMAFQYFNFDVCDCSIDNFNALNEFAVASGISNDHVSEFE